MAAQWFRWGSTHPKDFAPRIGRIPIRHLAPRQPEDRWPAKAFVGEVVPFEATVFREGHDELGVRLLLTVPNGTETRHPMVMRVRGTDRWHAEVRLDAPGTWVYRVRAFGDDWATWLHDAAIKVAAGHDVELMFPMGAELLLAGVPCAHRDQQRAQRHLPELGERLKAASDARLNRALTARPVASLTTKSEQVAVRVERTRAGVGTWYEFFPRSEGAKKRRDGSWTSGTFRTAAKRLPAVAAMGFDVVYLPPIHPIGHAFRKGPNNSPDAGPARPGQPVGDRLRGRAGTTRSTPTSAPSPTSRVPRRRPRRTASRSPSTSPCSAPPTIRG